MSFQKKFSQKVLSSANIGKVMSAVMYPDGGAPWDQNEGAFRICCPFHTEEVPSFTVYRNSNRFRCYGCGARGNVIEFVREYCGIPYHEALLIVAKISGVITPTGKEKPNRKKRMGRKRYSKKLSAVQRRLDRERYMPWKMHGAQATSENEEMEDIPF